MRHSSEALQLRKSLTRQASNHLAVLFSAIGRPAVPGIFTEYSVTVPVSFGNPRAHVFVLLALRRQVLGDRAGTVTGGD